MTRATAPANLTPEQDQRLNILNTLLTTPHRDLASIYPVHRGIIDADPLFYVRLASWYNDTGEVRDHKEMFVVNLCLSNFDGHRDVGLAMLRQLPPYQVARVVDFISGKKIKKTVQEHATTVARGRGRAKPKTTTKKVEENFGLFKTLPRSVKTEITRYLREREEDNKWFDSTVMNARKYLKRLYALAHIKPSERADQILFKDAPPEDSSLVVFKLLANTKEPAEQAKLIIKHKVPFRVAQTVVGTMTPTVLLALLEVMSDQELINNMGMLKKHGVFENPDLKQVVSERLEKAKTGKRVAALKATEAVKAAGLSDDLNKQLEEVADTQIKSKGRIARPTALLIDKSGSMSQAIEIGKRVASMISAIMDADFYVYAFDSMAYPIQSKGSDLASWEKAMVGIRAGGGTSCGCPFTYMTQAKQAVEQVIIITDEGDNTAPSFTAGYNRYCEALGVKPNVCIIKTQGASGHVEQNCRKQEIPVDTYQFTGDYYGLPNMVKFLTKPSRLDLLMEIMTWDLPERKASQVADCFNEQRLPAKTGSLFLQLFLK